MWAVETDPAAERRYAVFEADEAGATAEAGAAPTVVLNADAQGILVGLDGDRDRARRARV